MKFIVTGGLGFVGSHLAQYLERQGHDVIVVDNLHSGKLENLDSSNKIEFIKLDIHEYEKLKMLTKNVDGIFHQAALTSVQESFIKKDEYFDVNVAGTENVFKIARDMGIKVVFASSAAVYGDVKKIPIQEESERKPLNPYGETKLKSELLAEKYSKLGTSIVGLRYFNVYGPRQNSAYAGVITKFLENITNGKPLLIHGNGLQIRDFVSVYDIAEANLLAMENNVDENFFNVGSGIATSILDLANLFIDISGLSLKPIHTKSLHGDIQLSQADISLIKSSLNWKPNTNLKDWIQEFINTKIN